MPNIFLRRVFFKKMSKIFYRDENSWNYFCSRRKIYWFDRFVRPSINFHSEADFCSSLFFLLIDNFFFFFIKCSLTNGEIGLKLNSCFEATNTLKFIFSWKSKFYFVPISTPPNFFVPFLTERKTGVSFSLTAFVSNPISRN